MSENGWFELPSTPLERFRSEVQIAGHEREHAPDDMVTEVAALWAAVSVAETVVAELGLLAEVVAGFTDEEYGYHGGPYNNRMVADAARQVLERLGVQ